MKTLILGCGYVGMAVGRALLSRGDSVVGVCRSEEAAVELRKAGIEPAIADITRLESLQQLPSRLDAIANCVSSSRRGAAAYREVYLKGAANLLEWARRAPTGVIVFTGSTTVYAQTGGEWVDESSPTAPPHEAGKVLLEAERLYLDSGLPVVLLRLAGIYGPGRHAMLDKLRGGVTVLPGNGQHYVNMIHRDDIVQAILAALDRKPAGQIINVVDDEPTLQVEYAEWICRQLGRPMVQFDPDAESRFKNSMRKGFQPNRRVSNRRLAAALGVQLRFPTYREGLKPMITDRIL